ncbi:MAG: Asp-tRNA(Asn)/Glu-tRNA(Gln) amidotransferase subunit GatC [Candidatus Colwellbacteria bacterium]|nr:Asp-tRNA(Asn)/Glu-tRNA(Gln) amidotransferase subunit GatC [Candidatus Colwellbacteria bacterium]
MDINVEYLAKLARVELSEEEKRRFSGELGKILDHFKELQELDTENVVPMAGGTELTNVFRKDEAKERFPELNNAATKAFPDTKDGLLKVPKVL